MTRNVLMITIETIGHFLGTILHFLAQCNKTCLFIIYQRHLLRFVCCCLTKSHLHTFVKPYQDKISHFDAFDKILCFKLIALEMDIYSTFGYTLCNTYCTCKNDMRKMKQTLEEEQCILITVAKSKYPKAIVETLNYAGEALGLELLSAPIQFIRRMEN